MLSLTLSLFKIIEGLVAKVLTLNTLGTQREPVLIPAAPLPIQLPAYGLGKQLRMTQTPGTLHPCGKPGTGSRPLLQIISVLAVAATYGMN